MQLLKFTTSDTLSDHRFGKKEKMVPTSAVNIRIDGELLSLLKKSEKIVDLKMIREWSKLVSDYLINYESIRTYIQNEQYKIEIPVPVKIEKDEAGVESITYNSTEMEVGKLYEVNWQGERWALKKTDKEIEFMIFESEDK